MKRLLLSLLVVSAVATSAVWATNAFFSDSETSSGNVLAAGKIDLLIGNESYYNGAVNDGTSWLKEAFDETKRFFDFDDIKPGDWGEDTIELYVDNNDAWLCADLTITSNDDNGSNEPELDDGDTQDDGGNLFDGELGGAVNWVAWLDDGDNVLETDEESSLISPLSPFIDIGQEGTTWTLADSETNNLGGEDGEPASGATSYWIGKAWCFGELTINAVPEGQGENPTVASGIICNGQNLDNSTQTDVLTADVEFRAVQSRNNPDFLCEEPDEPVACVGPTYATSAPVTDQGLQKSGALVLPNRSVASAMFGEPETTGVDSDSGFPAGSFYSLGFKLEPAGPPHGSVVLGFSEPFHNDPGGPDLHVFEVTGGVYPDELVEVAVGPTSIGPWVVLGTFARDELVEMGGVATAQFVRLTDYSPIGAFPSNADGYDVDAVEALCGTVEQPQGDQN